ncbi:acetoacetate decarboxylase family protein [Natronolimnohabitans sp. A-GB9]|uniref:acetoacetate decarboxylase family protein n=1 Tax=Natronolimnohabitans sp. A-GB9 TaxID=3069757 RepID=UPI0027B3B386|nr:acetoacetate decarboxylase family protein [Natronolimnohabitans sp. A-GB9]MDQ2050470.1 acetoacetate decarboxylase family protein [Natronolimnohabitans sp. A-GB9]
MQPTPTDRRRVTLSTGHEVTLPLELECTVGGVTVLARRKRLESILPEKLAALAVAPGVGCVMVVGIRYHRVGRTSDESDEDGGPGLEPYDEFGVIVPAVRGSRSALPFLQAVDGEFGGYVHWLPVTTEASVALGREIWGYPKERAAISITDDPQGFRTVVRDDDGTQRVRLEVPRPWTRIGSRQREWALWSYTTMDGELVRTRAELEGEIALGSPVGASLEIDPELQTALGCRPQPLARLYGTRVRARLSAGKTRANRS